MASFSEVLLLFIFFWLRSRRLRLDQARRRRIAAQSVGLAIVVSQWCLISRVAITAALRLLQGNRLQRRLWVKPRSASFFQDIVPGWNDADFKGNFRISRATFAYLVNELQPVLERQEFCAVPFLWISELLLPSGDSGRILSTDRLATSLELAYPVLV